MFRFLSIFCLVFASLITFLETPCVVAKRGQIFIFPGVSGSGKTSLCLHLVTHGFTCYSDELAVINKDFSPQPLPFPVSIKSGAWPLFDSAWPELGHSKIWEKDNGIALKYLLLPTDLDAPVDSKITQQTIIFPTFDPEAVHASYKKLSPTQALVNIIQAGYQIKQGLNQANIVDLISFVNTIPACEFRFRHFDDLYSSEMKVLF